MPRPRASSSACERREATCRTRVTEPRLVRSQDGTSIAVFELGGGGSPVLLVHGTTADHTTWRVSGPLLAARFRVFAMDRRGRGASGDGDPYGIELEFEDVAAVAEALAQETGRAVDVVGHSYGGRVALGAAFRTRAVRRIVAYESAPTNGGPSYLPPGSRERLEALAEAGDGEALLAAFMTDVVGLTRDELSRYRADPVWPARVAAAGTILREISGETSGSASIEILGSVTAPVLQVLGSASRPAFGIAARKLDERLVDGRIVVIAGAKHAAHHTHAEQFVAEVGAFLLERAGDRATLRS
jgi:pimeloyl-ACP methyl ester carboxylesterase